MKLGGATLLVSLLTAPASAEPLVSYGVQGDAIEQPLNGLAGDPARGQALVLDRRHSLCLLCHAGPFGAAQQGTLGPDLAGVGARLSAGQLRLRLVDSKRLDPAGIMPAYYRAEGLTRVGEAWRGQPILTAQEIEDVVAYLVTLKE